ncbi:hypothetical protein J6590_039962 [Homalodisca vitripennis]|nr:hypothetical protein J6590_039962 [Homalodisca vitripennis]
MGQQKAVFVAWFGWSIIAINLVEAAARWQTLAQISIFDVRSSLLKFSRRLQVDYSRKVNRPTLSEQSAPQSAVVPCPSLLPQRCRTVPRARIGNTVAARRGTAYSCRSDTSGLHNYCSVVASPPSTRPPPRYTSNYSGLRSIAYRLSELLISLSVRTKIRLSSYNELSPTVDYVEGSTINRTVSDNTDNVGHNVGHSLSELLISLSVRTKIRLSSYNELSPTVDYVEGSTINRTVSDNTDNVGHNVGHSLSELLISLSVRTKIRLSSYNELSPTVDYVEGSIINRTVSDNTSLKTCSVKPVLDNVGHSLSSFGSNVEWCPKLHTKGPHTPASLAREPGSTRLEMDQIRQCMDNKEPSRVKFRRAEPDPPLLAVRLGSARLEYQFASVWRITDRTRAPTTEKSVHSVFTTAGQTLRTTRSAKVKVFCLF